MAEHVIKMPDVGEGVTEAEIVAWHVKVGDTVEEDEDLVDVMTDKATVEIPSPVSGRIVRVSGNPGDMIPVGTEFIVIETAGASAADASAPEPEDKPEPAPVKPVEHTQASEKKAPEPSAPPISSPKVSRDGQRPLASPAVRQRASELDVDLSAVSGSGPAGRILRSDLDDFVASGGRAIARTGNTGSQSAPKTGTETSKVIGLRRKIARNMETAWTVPMITYVEEIDVTELENLRKKLNARKQDDQPKLTLLPFLAAALIKALPKIPQANAHYNSEADELTLFDGVHLGIATATESGLVVPVVKHAEAMSIWQFANELKTLSDAVRNGTASRDQLSGSTITITSLGALGGITTTPILNPPETSIIGVNKLMERPVFDGNGNVVPRLFMNLSSTFDHRIVDGYDAAILIQKVREYLETPATLFIPD